MNRVKNISLLSAIALVASGCMLQNVKGTVYKQKTGTFKAAYTSNDEDSIRRTLHSDAKITCKQETGSKRFVVVDESFTALEAKESDKKGLDSALSFAGKVLGTTEYRGELEFECEA